MGSFTVGGASISTGKLKLPVEGIWLGTFVVDSDKAITGNVDLELPGLTLKGTVLPDTGGIVEGICHVRLVGGKAGLRKMVEGQHFQFADGRTIVQRTLQDVGEQLSQLSDQQALARTFDHWMRMRGTAAAAIASWADHEDLHWRVEPDGSVWIGVTQWEPREIPADLITDDVEHGRLELATDDQTIVPGITLKVLDVSSVTRTEPKSWRVVSVEHYFFEDATWRSYVTYQQGAAPR